MSRSIISATLALGLSLCMATLVAAADFAAPKGEVLLTVKGSIAARNVGDSLQLDEDQLAALPQTEFTTATTWTSGKLTFKGILLKDLIASVGATGKTITLKAANDYAITITADDVKPDAPLLAYLMDGKTMSLREKGPVWMVYPYDQNEAYRTEETYARSIWQLTEITFGE